MDKPIRWLTETLTTPPFSTPGRKDCGRLLRRLQRGEILRPPTSKPMTAIAPRCHELRVKDAEARATWRVIYRIDDDAIVVVHWYDKNTDRMPKQDVATCDRRLRQYDTARRTK